ncbi:hypothetical protein Aple_065870 [Acrocarpospora pleiomorpha]|uniref:Uncharacterized protein n=1 Tax=Acrocarpospora pleiomorpha TaxID=90975 RepID=A0A5M3XZ91_9ACTN|nr:hypothetical protein [Acrocarpospora pleiomorpha]GES23688.1 hypothetical protein Aple_065870 [Acrocarpospora pleiomorpha]
MTHTQCTSVTVSMRPDEQPHVAVHFTSPDLEVRALLVNDQRPLLWFASREADIYLSTSADVAVTDRDLSLARELFTAASRYLADCERIHTNQVDQADTHTTETTEATDQAPVPRESAA